MIAKYWILNIEVAILLRSTLADKVRFLRAASFEGVTDHHQNTLWTFTKNMVMTTNSALMILERIRPNIPQKSPNYFQQIVWISSKHCPGRPHTQKKLWRLHASKKLKWGRSAGVKSYHTLNGLDYCILGISWCCDTMISRIFLIPTKD